jgi:hypothetical protein
MIVGVDQPGPDRAAGEAQFEAERSGRLDEGSALDPYREVVRRDEDPALSHRV